MNALAEVFPPGEFLQDELEARHWSQIELAEIMGRPQRLISEIIQGKKAITAETAQQLGKALGTSAEFWLNLESMYQLSKVGAADDQIAQRAALYGRFPVREMVKRGWLSGSEKVDVLERQLLAFFGIASLDAPLSFCHAARKTEAESAPSMLQLAWLCRARAVARGQEVSVYEPDHLLKAIEHLKSLRLHPEGVQEVARILRQAGIRLVVVEPIKGSKIDGACFWLADDEPVIALSLRLDRIDNFWFVLRHELEHVLLNHGRDEGFIIDMDVSNLAAAQISEEERLANEAATLFCAQPDAIDSFLARVGPYVAEKKVLALAEQLGVHPGLIVGQLQRRLQRYDLLRKHQVKVRELVIRTARTDGWGAGAAEAGMAA